MMKSKTLAIITIKLSVLGLNTAFHNPEFDKTMKGYIKNLITIAILMFIK